MQALAALLLATQLVVVNQGSQTLSFVDTGTLTVRKSIPMQPAPHEVVLSDDGKLAFVSLYGNHEVAGDSIAVVDVASATEVRRLKVHKRPHGLAFRDGRLYITAEQDRKLVAVDPESGDVLWSGATGGAGSHMLAVAPDVSRIYCGNIGSNSASILPIGDGEAKTIAVGAGPEGIDLSPDGKELWVAHRGGGGVSVIDTATQAVVATILPEVVSARVRFTPDGTRVLLFDMAGSALVVVDRATRKETGRVAMPGMPGGGIVSADSRTAYVSVYGPFLVARVDLEKLEISGRVETGIAPDGMALAEINSAPPKRRRAAGHGGVQ